MESDSRMQQKGTNLHQQMSPKNFENLVAKHNKQSSFMETNKPDITNKPATAKEMGMDRTYLEKRLGKHHQRSTSMEPTWKEE